MQRKTGTSRPQRARPAATPAVEAVNGAMAHMAKTTNRPAARTVANEPAARTVANDGGLAAWLARYEPVEREIIEAHERRIANRARRSEEHTELQSRI